MTEAELVLSYYITGSAHKAYLSLKADGYVIGHTAVNRSLKAQGVNLQQTRQLTDAVKAEVLHRKFLGQPHKQVASEMRISRQRVAIILYRDRQAKIRSGFKNV